MDPTQPPLPFEPPLGTAEADVSRETPGLKVFILPPAQIARIREAGGPLAEVDDLSRLASMAIVPVVERDGKIVAYWPVFKAVHAEPLWVATEARMSATVIRAILHGVESALSAMGDPVAFAIISEDDEGLVSGKYATRLGFRPVPGELYYVMLPQKEGVH
jgi:hypothetical protein